MSCVVVLGLKRGFTSLASNIVHRLGFVMGETFVEPDQWNEGGYFEDMEFADVVDRILNGAVIHNGRIVQCNPEVLAEFQDLIDARNRKYPRWGIKNFGLNFLLPEFVSRCRTPVHLLRVTRVFAEAVHSWSKRFQGSRQLHEIILEQAEILYNTDVVYFLHPGPKLTVSSEDLLSSPRDTVGRIARFLGVPEVEEGVYDIVRADRKKMNLVPR